MNEQYSAIAKRPFFLLPYDCWADVIKYLAFPDILSICTTCKSLNATAELFLYQKLDVGWNTDKLPLQQVLQLLRTIFAKPELASSVHHVSLLSSSAVLPWANLTSNVNWDKQASCFEDVMGQAVGVAQDAQFHNAEDWVQALREGNFFAFTAIFISQLSGLRSLHLDYSFVWMGGYPGQMMKHALLSPNGVLSTFDCLCLVDYGGNVPLPMEFAFDSGELWPDSFPSSYNSNQFHGWFYLASLQHLEIWLRDTTKLKESKLKLNLDCLQTLILARSTISEEDVFSLLTQTQSLKDLHLGLAYHWKKPHIFQNSELFIQALESVRNTVTNLSIGTEYYPHCMGECHFEEGREHSLESFKGVLKKFTNLQTAELPITLLVGLDPSEAIDLGKVLPDTLRNLVLRNDLGNVYEYQWETCDFLDCVHDFLTKSDWRSITPQLQHIYLRLLPLSYDPSYWPEEERNVWSACKKDGIHFKIILDSLSSGFYTSSTSRFVGSTSASSYGKCS